MSIDQAEEINRLDGVASGSLYQTPAGVATIAYSTRIFGRYWHGRERCLEMGPAEGVGTEIIASFFSDLTLLEGSETFCQTLRRKFPAASVVHSLFEHYRPDRKFDVIVLGHVLEHVESPTDVLRLVRQWLTPTGIICSAVPNARSLHRQAAVIMGLLKSEYDLSALDLHHGHRRVYNPESFRRDFIEAGLKIDVFGGYWLKPVSNAQLESTWTPAMLDAFMQLGERYPDIAGEIYVIASR